MNYQKSRLYFIILFFCSFLWFISCKNNVETPATKITNQLIGSWKMQSVYWISKDTTYAINQAQPGIFFFTDKRYAIMWTSIEKPRTPFKSLSNPTEKEMIHGFRSVVFNAGSYSSTDSTLISTVFLAKVPGFEKGKQFYNYKIENDILTLIMVDETYPDGTKPQWSGKYKTKFVLKRDS